MEFKASFDTPVKLITTGCILLFIIVGTFNVTRLINTAHNFSIPIAISIIVLFIATIVACAAFAPIKYVLTTNQLVIKRLAGNVCINYRDIAKIVLLPDNDAQWGGGWGVRTFGSGGVFGYLGKFYHSSFGNYTAYATQQKNKVFITTVHGSKLLITPDDKNLVYHLEEHLAAA